MIDLNSVDKLELFNHYCNTLEREVDLKYRIEKAINYIEHAHFMNINYKDGLLKILKGSEEDEK